MTSTSGAALHTYAETLTPRAPYSFTQSLRFMERFTPTGGEQSLGAGTLTKAIALGGRAAVFTIRETGGVEQPRLAVTLTAATPLDAASRAALRDRIRFFLSLDDDLADFYAAARSDPAMAPVIQRLYGLHQPKFLTPFEQACWAVLTQRTPIAIARRVKDRITDRYGARLVVGGVEYRAFPEVETLAAADSGELAALVGVARKAEYLAAVIAFFQRTSEAWLRTAPVAEVEAALRGVRGIGPWSATFLLVRGLGRMDADLSESGTLSREAGQVYGSALTPARRAALLDHYGPWRGYWLFYCRNASGASGMGGA